MKAIFKTSIFTIVVPGAVTVLFPYSLLPSCVDLFRGDIWGIRLIGVLPTAVGIVFYLTCAWDFAFSGKGTPAPFDPPKVLVLKGLYQKVRNPMYVSVLLIIIGESTLFASWALLEYALIVWLVFHLFVVFYEEPTLKKKFGSAYEEYLNTVPRWIPRLKGGKGG